MKSLFVVGAVSLVILSVAGCKEEKTDEVVESPIARAGSAYIYHSDIDYHLGTFDEKARNEIISDAATLQRLTESIALSEIMAQKQLEAMSDDQVEDLEASVRAYRRQRLAAEYAAERASDRAITMDELRAYYENHPEFSGEAGSPRPFNEVLPQLRKELAVQYLRDQVAADREQLNKDIEYFD